MGIAERKPAPALSEEILGKKQVLISDGSMIDRTLANRPVEQTLMTGSAW